MTATLARILLARPAVHALMALFHPHAARFETRADADGDLLLLAEQDRSRWDQGHIAAWARYSSAQIRGTS